MTAESSMSMLFALPSRLEGDPALHFALEAHATADYSGTALLEIDTATAQAGVTILDGTAWVAFPSEGAGTVYYGKLIGVAPNEAMSSGQFYVRYKLYFKGEDPTAEPWQYNMYPAQVVTGAEGTGTGVDGKSTYEIWLELGNEGDEADFIESQRGKLTEVQTHNPANAYEYLDLVTVGDPTSTYQCINVEGVSVGGAAPPNTNYWRLIAGGMTIMAVVDELPTDFSGYPNGTIIAVREV